MKRSDLLIPAIVFVACSLFLGSSFFVYEPVTGQSNDTYKYRAIHDRDGIGKFYLGREVEEQPSKVIEALNLQPTDVVADIGAGSGYISFRLAEKVPDGKVLAVDIQPEMLDIIDFLAKENPDLPVKSVLGSETSSNLSPASIDLALMIDTYHEFAYPQEMMESIFQALKPQGRVVLVEYRKENPLIAIKGAHKMTQKQVKKEMKAIGLQWVTTEEFLPQQHYMVFEKRAKENIIESKFGVMNPIGVINRIMEL